MKLLIDTYKKSGTLHHAYLLVGKKEVIRPELMAFIEESLQIQTKANPDVWHSVFETLSVDDARALRDTQANKALGTGKKIFIIETQAMTAEAQNALLKVFEEPTPDTHFFIIVPSAELFLPTLRSRVQLISQINQTEDNKEDQKEIKAFIDKNISERLKIVGEIVEAKDKTKAIELVDGLITYFHKLGSKNPAILRELLMCRTYLNDRSPSMKLLLEHIALVM